MFAGIDGAAKVNTFREATTGADGSATGDKQVAQLTWGAAMTTPTMSLPGCAVVTAAPVAVGVNIGA